jgi:hypothetical protein
MRKLRIIYCLLFISVLFYSPAPVSADIAPPSEPPGSNINPGEKTNVQMIAENVLMVVKLVSNGKYVIEVTADFAMRNQGESEEHLRVRFPMEDIMGSGDGWGGRPEISGFSTWVDGIQMQTEIVEEPYVKKSIPLKWSVFDVTFPPGKDTGITVRYTTDLQDDLQPNIEYTLGTGAGWFGSIGTAVVTIRLPYAASTANVFLDETEAVLVGKEVRQHWQNYEPEEDEVVQLSIVHPEQWLKILELEAKTGVEPSNLPVVLELSEAYRQAGSEKHGCMINEALADLSEMAVEQALALYPSDISLHSQLVEVYDWRLGCGRYEWETADPTIHKLLDELQILLKLDPTNVRVQELDLQWKKILASLKTPEATMIPTEIATPTPTESAPSPTLLAATATQPVASLPTHTKTSQTNLTLPVTETPAPQILSREATILPIQVIIPLSLLMIAVVSSVVIERIRVKRL